MKRIEFNLENLENLCKLMPTWEEIGVFFGCSYETIKRRMREEPEFKEAAERGFTEGKLSLRRWQMQAAEKGSAAMLIFLGKNMLGQKDQVDQVITGNMTQAFTIKAPHEYRIPQASPIPEANTSDLPYEEIRTNGSNH